MIERNISVVSSSPKLLPKGREFRILLRVRQTVVVASNNARNAETLVVQPLDNLGSTESSWIIDGDSVIVGVESLDEVLI